MTLSDLKKQQQNNMPTAEADANKSKKATINLSLSDTSWFDEKNISTEVYPLIQVLNETLWTYGT